MPVRRHHRRRRHGAGFLDFLGLGVHGRHAMRRGCGTGAMGTYAGRIRRRRRSRHGGGFPGSIFANIRPF